MELWHRNEQAWNRYLYKSKGGMGIESVGQCESWVKLKTGEYHFFEVKTQEVFDPPPFYGHGLPTWQVEKYLQMESDLSIVWHLVIFDMSDHHLYEQKLATLETAAYIDTPKNPRRIYALDAYNIIFEDWRLLDAPKI